MNGIEGQVIAICVCPGTGERMIAVPEVEAITGAGLKGDRYCVGEGSFNRGNIGKRQVTLVNGTFFAGSSFKFNESRRNIVTMGVELMWLIGRDKFRIGEAWMRAVKYCDPCDRPSKLANKSGFREQFFDRGGIIAEVIEGGLIKIGDPIIPPPKGY